MIIRKINISDTNSISELHKKVFDKTYFSVYYTINDLSKYFQSLIDLNAYSYVVEDAGRIVGYLIGGFKTQEAVDKFIRKNLIRIFYYILSNPKFIVISIEKTFKKIFSKKFKSKADLRLFLIGVDPLFKNRGMGALLMEKFEGDILADGYNIYGLYVRTNNLNAVNFYLKRNFKKEFKTFDLFSFIKKVN